MEKNDNECVFLYGHSRLCKYWSNCERDYCMFKHEFEIKEVISEETNEIAVDKNEVVDEADAITVIVDVDVHENIIDCESMEIKEKSKNVKEDDVEIDILEASNNIGAVLNVSNVNNADNTSGGKLIFDCQLFNYQAEKKYDITSHLEDIHNWCYICFSTFDNQENLKKHVQTNHCKF